MAKDSKYKTEMQTMGRRFLRVITSEKEGISKPIESLVMTWEDGQILKVFDVSYGGVACEVPKDEPLQTSEVRAFRIQFPWGLSYKFIAEVVWVTNKFIGLNFSPLSIESRQALNKFLDDKMLGLGLRLIDKKFYSEKMTCQYWYQGGFGVNMYLWENDGKIIRCELELEDFLVKLNGENFEIKFTDLKGSGASESIIIKKTINILSQIAVKENAVMVFLKSFIDKMNLKTE
jgi:hypothetical protein